MTLEDAIKHAEEVAKENERICQIIPEHSAGAFHCAEEHRQLAMWLKELKRYKEQGPCAFCKHNSFEESAPCYRCPAGMSFAGNIIVKVVEE